MKSKKDKVIVVATGVLLTVIFLIALIWGDAAAVKVNNDAGTTDNNVAENNSDKEPSKEENSSPEQSDNQSQSGDNESSSSDEQSSEEESTAAPVENEFFLVNISDYVNVRKGPSTDQEVVGKIYSDGGGEVLEKGAEWTKVKSGNVEGYVATKYLWFGEEAESKLSTVGKKIGTVTTTNLRVRAGKGTSYDILGELDINTEIEIEEEGDEWHQIIYENRKGYVSAQYIKIRYEYSLGVTLEEDAAIQAEEAARLAAIKAEEERIAAAEAAAIEKAIAESKVVDIVKTAAYTTVSDEEAYLMACVITLECGHDVYEGQLAVANIILNRYNGNGYGDTVKDVLYAKNQFSVVESARFQELLKSGPNDSSVKAVSEALSGINNVPSYTNYRSLSGATSADYEAMKEYSIIGHQIFYSRK